MPRSHLATTVFPVALLLLAGAGSPAGASTAPSATTPIAQRYAAAAEQIIAAALASDDAYQKLRQLCDDHGQRLSGSAGLEQAIAWAADRLRADGADAVRLEPVTVPHWVRGAESLALVEPYPRAMPMLGLGGSVGTPPDGITAEVIAVDDEAALAKTDDQVRGKVVLFNNDMTQYHRESGWDYGTAVRFRSHGARLAAVRGAVACLVTSVTPTSLRSPHTGALSYGDAQVKIPAAAITVEDALLIARLLERGHPVRVTLRMEAEQRPPAPSANVIGELRGTTHPHEIVVIGGHIDAWDVGQGAHDDGAGCVMAMAALKVIRDLGLRPRRTIRVVLWTNEENGLAGAKAYAEQHAAELPDHVAAIESDSGAFPPVGYALQCTDSRREQVAAGQMADILGLLGRFGATRVKVGSSAADVSPMRSKGVVVMGHEVEMSTYFNYHHSHADTFDKVDPAELARNVAVMATVAYVLADMPERLGQAAD